MSARKKKQNPEQQANPAKSRQQSQSQSSSQGRLQQGRRSKRKLNKRHNHNRTHTTNDDIVEQLRRQREQQQQQQQREEALKTGVSDPVEPSNTSTNIEGYVYDPERDAYFPEESISLPKKRKDDTSEYEPVEPNPFPPARLRSPVYHLPIQSSAKSALPSSHYYCSWLSLYGSSKYMTLPSLRLTTVANWAGRTVLSRFQKYADVTCWDSTNSTGPIHLPAWCRTADMGFDEKGFQINKDDCAAFTSTDRSFRCVTPPCTPPDTFYHLRHLTSCRRLTALATCNHSFSSSLLVVLSHEDISRNRVIPGVANDVVGLESTSTSSEKLLVATNSTRQKSYLVSAVDTERVSALSCRPLSDALCMEALDANVAVVGHRNGLVTLYDVRERFGGCCNQSNQYGSKDWGNIVRIEKDPLRGNSHNIVIRTSHPDGGGRLALLDVRSSGSNQRQQPVWTAETMVNAQRHRGMAIVSSAVVVLPGGGSLQPNTLDAWSLATGQHLGSQPVSGDCGNWTEVVGYNNGVWVRSWDGKNSSWWTLMNEENP